MTFTDRLAEAIINTNYVIHEVEKSDVVRADDVIEFKKYTLAVKDFLYVTLTGMSMWRAENYIRQYYPNSFIRMFRILR